MKEQSRPLLREGAQKPWGFSYSLFPRLGSSPSFSPSGTQGAAKYPLTDTVTAISLKYIAQHLPFSDAASITASCSPLLMLCSHPAGEAHTAMQLAYAPTLPVPDTKHITSGR